MFKGRAITLCAHKATADDELTVVSGEIIEVQFDPGSEKWVYGHIDNRKGCIPRSCLKILTENDVIDSVTRNESILEDIRKIRVKNTSATRPKSHRLSIGNSLEDELSADADDVEDEVDTAKTEPRTEMKPFNMLLGPDGSGASTSPNWLSELKLKKLKRTDSKNEEAKEDKTSSTMDEIKLKPIPPHHPISNDKPPEIKLLNRNETHAEIKLLHNNSETKTSNMEDFKLKSVKHFNMTEAKHKFLSSNEEIKVTTTARTYNSVELKPPNPKENDLPTTDRLFNRNLIAKSSGGVDETKNKLTNRKENDFTSHENKISKINVKTTTSDNIIKVSEADVGTDAHLLHRIAVLEDLMEKMKAKVEKLEGIIKGNHN